MQLAARLCFFAEILLLPMNFKLLAAGLLLSAPTLAQQPLPVPLNLQATFAKGTRSADGQPGPKYWQNSADYDLKVSFDPGTRLVKGTADITYRNNSPDSLRQI